MTIRETQICSTPFGAVRGTHVDGVSAFRRVPYAESPTGVRRYQRPVSPARWTEVLDATEVGTIPPQLPSRLDDVMGIYPAAQDENCLHLDIWSPSRPGDKTPVLVFIHGGAFMTGGGSLPCYDGAQLARQARLVIVNISYRLGVFGFLPMEGAANLGLHDQIAALRWVRQAITSFGGDPGNVTVIGQSAGAFSIAVMLAQKFAPDLFDKAVMMSAPLGLNVRTPQQMQPFLTNLLETLGVSDVGPMALRDIPVQKILEALQVLARRPRPNPFDITPAFMPVIDGELLDHDFVATLNGGSAKWCPTIIGVTREEAAAFFMLNPEMDKLNVEAVRSAFNNAYGTDGMARMEAAQARLSPTSMKALIADMATDAFFLQPTLDFITGQSRHGGPGYMYSFDWQAPREELGATHCIDLPHPQYA